MGKNDKENWGGARKGAGRSSLFKGEKKQKITLSLTYKAIEKLNEEAEYTGYSRSDILNDLVINYLVRKQDGSEGKK